MRAIVLALAVLAGLKIWTQDTFYRAATEDAVIEAYRDRAIAACQKEPQKDKQGRQLAPSIVTWASPASVRLVIGNSTIPVRIWELDHERWDQRFKHAYIVLAAGERHARLICAYDIARRSAEITHI